MMIPTGMPTIAPIATAIVDCHATTAGELATGESECLQQREVAPAAPHRRDEREYERDDGADRERAPRYSGVALIDR